MKPFSSYFNNSIFEFLCISRSNCSFSANDTQSVGQLNVFTVSQGKPISLAFQKTGGDNFQSYGSSIAVGKPLPDGTPVLAVGATGQSKWPWVLLDGQSMWPWDLHWTELCILGFYTLDRVFDLRFYTLDGVNDLGFCTLDICDLEICTFCRVCDSCFLNTGHSMWWRFLTCVDLGRMFDHWFQACAFLFKVEICSCTLIPLFIPGSVHSGSASWDNCGQKFPNKLRVSLFSR